jgi:glutaminyl-tRNA synthetase
LCEGKTSVSTIAIPIGCAFANELNPNSLELIAEAGRAGVPVQFERQGYFCPDKDSTPDNLVFNRTVGLRDTWAKVSGGG